MIVVTAIFDDEASHVLFAKESAFDVHAWAQVPSRQKAFRLLGIKRIVVAEMEGTTHAAS